MTLVEVMISSIILLILVAAMLTFFNVIQRTNIRQEKRNEITGQMRLAIDNMTKEIRQASVIRITSSASVMDMDTYVNGTSKHVVWTATGTILTRSVDGGAARTFLEGLTSTNLFTYAPGITDATDITIDLRARPVRFTADPAVVRLTSQVRLRNRSAA